MEIMTYKKCLSIKRDDGLRMRSVDEFTMNALLRCTVSRNFKRPFMSVYGDNDVITYGKFNYIIQNIRAFLVNKGLKKGDKVALLGESSPNWMIAYFSITTIGAIAVPILPEFSKKEIAKILEHSEAKAIVVNSKQFDKVSTFCIDNPRAVVRMDDLFYIPEKLFCDIKEKKDFEEAAGIDIKSYKRRAKENKELDEIKVNEDDLASIIYTSGTTGTSKGVMLSHKNLVWNADISSDAYVKITPRYKFLSILPVAHVYEFTEGQLLMMMNGAQIIFLGKPPAPSILLPALNKIKPQILLSVPLLMEKVYRSAVLPTINKNKNIQNLIKNPITRPLIYRLIGSKLKITFGGRVKFFGLGGAPLDKEVEDFLYRAKFPYAIGYGLTETSPLVAACGYKKSDHKRGTIGKFVPNVQYKLLNKDPKTGVGEIVVKGPGVMKGYYKNNELNKEVFTEDGYFRTGDLGVVVKKRLLLKGRSKTMILGSGGENIYPEAIESIFNNQEFVEETLVIPEGSSLVALIKIDYEAFAKITKLSFEDSKAAAFEYINKLKRDINKELNSFSKIHEVTLQDEPFQRTPTQKIKRFLYLDRFKKDKTGKDEENKESKDK
ncbi:MAG: long-chain fatty acid--CoA ligase [Spirochaetia bacterium]|nr:long-chain fatty acid--CoA ligase [Spirochaetia bacterium]